MTDYNIEDFDLWYLDQQSIPKKKGQANNKVYALYLCESCNYIWEISTSGSIIRYKHIPRYGKEKKTCLFCKKGHNKPYKER